MSVPLPKSASPGEGGASPSRSPRRLVEEAERYRQLAELQGDYLSLATGEGVLLYVNEAYARLHDVRPDDLIGRNLFDFVPEEQLPALKAQLLRCLAERRPISSKNQVRGPGGGLRWVHWTNLAFVGRDGGVALHSVGRDIQAQIETETRLRESEARFRMLAELSLDVIIALDRDLRRTYVSPSSREMFGYEPEELIGGLTGCAAHPDDAGTLHEALRTLLAGERERLVNVARRRHRDGRWIWTEACYRAVPDPLSGEVSGIVATVRDITERKALEERLAQDNLRLEALAGQDGLTGLANRRMFDAALAKEHNRASRGEERLCLLMIDVDRFKAFNDAYGHLAGDDALRRVAQAIRPCLRRVNDLAVRYGGEEFVVLSPGTGLDGGRHVAETIRLAVRGLGLPHAGSEHGVVTVSIGVAAAARADFMRDREALVAGADAALYEAKRAGRDVVRCAANPITSAC